MSLVSLVDLSSRTIFDSITAKLKTTKHYCSRVYVTPAVGELSALSLAWRSEAKLPPQSADKTRIQSPAEGRKRESPLVLRQI